MPDDSMPFTGDKSEIGSTASPPPQIIHSSRSIDSKRNSEQNEESMVAPCANAPLEAHHSSTELFFPLPKADRSFQERMHHDSLLPNALRIRHPEASAATSAVPWDGLPESESPEDPASRPLGAVRNEDRILEEPLQTPHPTEGIHQGVKDLLETVEEIWIRSLGDDAFHDPLSSYLSPTFQFLQQEAQKEAIIHLSDWLRVAEWWALKGNMGVRKILDSRQSPPTQLSHHVSDNTLQSACDLKKAQWICYCVIPSHAETTQLRNVGLDRIDTVDLAALEPYSDIFRRYRSIEKIIEIPVSTMAHIQRDYLDQISSAELDLRLFQHYPALPPEYEPLVHNFNESLPTGVPHIVTSDTSLAFHYNNSFVETRLWPKESSIPSPPFACVFSIIRERDSSQSKWILASQTHFFQVVIHSHGNGAITWKDVRWDVDQKCMWISIAEGVQISAEFEHESEFSRHWSAASRIGEFVSRVSPRVDERVLFDSHVKLAHHKNYSTPSEFSARPVELCAVRLFEQRVEDFNSEEAMETGIFRMVLATPDSQKYTSSVSLSLGRGSPVPYNVFDSIEGFPSIMIDISNQSETCTVLISFETPEERDYLQCCLIGLSSYDPETKEMTFAIQSFSVSKPQRPGEEPAPNKLDFGGGSTTVIGPLLGHSLNHGQTRKSECLRIVYLTEQGSFTDRIIDLQYLQIGLDVLKTNSIYMSRTEQPRILTTVASGQASQDARDAMKDLGTLMSKSSSVHVIEFVSKQDLHTFIESIFGYTVIFDGLVNDFIFTRPRTKIPLATKRWCAGLTRIQVLRRNNSFQLFAAFNNFRHGRCMSFAVKSTDEIVFFEDKNGYGVRIIDAKYPMPNEDLAGVSLASPQYPAEHGDLTIVFTEKSVRDTFATNLPAFAKEYYI